MGASRILLADDDAGMLANVALHLRNEQYTVVCATDGLEALTAAQSEDPDVLLITVELMVDEKMTLCEELSKHPVLRRIPIIYLVGERTVRLGNLPRVPTRSMIFKPLHTDELFAKVEQALSTGKRRRELGRIRLGGSRRGRAA